MQRNLNVVRVQLRGVTTKSVVEIEALSTDQLVGRYVSAPPSVFDSARQRGFEPLGEDPSVVCNEIGLILGEDYYDAVVRGPTCRLTESLRVTWSEFGWLLHGCNGDASDDNALVVRVFPCSVKDSSLSRFWLLEHLGIVDDPSDKGELILQHVERDAEGRYVVKWPWLSEDVRPARNLALATRRLQRLEKTLTSEECEQYDAAIRQLVADGHAELAEYSSDGRESFVPHRPVFKKDRATTKVRVVIDPSSSSKAEGFALNQCLYAGPSLLPLLFDMVLRFRLGKYALVADVEKAFLQIGLDPESREYVKFLWDGEVYRMARLPFGVNCSPAVLQATLFGHFESELVRVETAQALKRSLYMDDVVRSLFSELCAVVFWDESVAIFADARMNLRKLRSNVESLKERPEHVEEVEGKVLGVTWNSESDVLKPAHSLSVIDVPCSGITKRTLASVLAKVFDPMGLISPVLTPLKALLQDLWVASKGWDEVVNTDPVIETLQSFSSVAKSLSDVQIPRWIGYESGMAAQVHIFCDASRRIYAACAYLRLEGPSGVKAQLLASKARLVTPALAQAPFSPKLELLGCYLGAKLGQSVVGALETELPGISIQFWTDSQVCIRWIKNTGVLRKDVFVKNRLDHIRRVSESWSYVPSGDNPADIPSRGACALADLWWRGPCWLSQGRDQWPEQLVIEESDSETCNVGVTEDVRVELDVVESPRVSSWRKLVRAQAWIQRWICRKPSNSPGQLSVLDENLGEEVVVRQVQKYFFSGDLDRLKAGSGALPSSRLSTLMPVVDGKGLIRLGGRIQRAGLSDEETHPVVLARCKAVDLLIEQVHKDLGHVGAATVLVELRRRGLWILQGRRAIRAALLSCGTCRRYRARPASEVTPPFPVERTVYTRPFDVVGVDAGGPLLLANGKKVWFLLFTCFEVRAVHIELIGGMSVEDLGNAMMKFIARRGEPRQMWSDHGTSFVGFSRWCSLQGLKLQWRFIVERAPWWGGLWERLIGCVKRLLVRMVGRKRCSWDELQALLARVEVALNRRPISYVYESSTGGIPVPLYPERFLLGACGSAADPTATEPSLAEKIARQKVWATDLEALWKKEYVMGVLGESRKVWKTVRPITRGEVVLLEDEVKKRQLWELGVVEEVYPGSDGRVRAVRLRTARGRFNRPIRRLFPLEIQSQGDS